MHCFAFCKTLTKWLKKVIKSKGEEYETEAEWNQTYDQKHTSFILNITTPTFYF